MKKFGFVFLFSFALVAIGAVSCASSSSKKKKKHTVDESTSYYSITKDDFPTCNAARKGGLAYATDEAKFYNCDGSTWNIVSIGTEGAVGATGATGSTGATGPAGADGSSDAINIYDGNGDKVGGLISFSATGGVAVQMSSGWAEFNISTGAVNGLKYYDYTGSIVTLSGTAYFANADCKGNVIISSDGAVSAGTGTEGGLRHTNGVYVNQLVPIKTVSTGGGLYWMRLTQSSVYATSSSYGSTATFDSTKGYFVCSGTSSGTVTTTYGGISISYTTLGGIGSRTVTTAGGTDYLNYPLTMPLKIGNF